VKNSKCRFLGGGGGRGRLGSPWLGKKKGKESRFVKGKRRPVQKQEKKRRVEGRGSVNDKNREQEGKEKNGRSKNVGKGIGGKEGTVGGEKEDCRKKGGRNGAALEGY